MEDAGSKFLTLAEISAKIVAYGNLKKNPDPRRLGAIMTKLGFEKSRSGHNRTRGYYVYEHSTAEIERSAAFVTDTNQTLLTNNPALLRNKAGLLFNTGRLFENANLTTGTVLRPVGSKRQSRAPCCEIYHKGGNWAT